jgi:hypothetical protein
MLDKIKFKLKEKTRANKIFFLVNYSGGDSDTEHPVEFEYSFPYSEWKSNIETIESDVKAFKILKEILEDRVSSSIYDQVLEEHGPMIANLFDSVPNDPQCDYQYRCYIDSIELIGYDDMGNKYKALI